MLYRVHRHDLNGNIGNGIGYISLCHGYTVTVQHLCKLLSDISLIPIRWFSVNELQIVPDNYTYYLIRKNPNKSPLFTVQPVIQPPPSMYDNISLTSVTGVRFDLGQGYTYSMPRVVNYHIDRGVDDAPRTPARRVLRRDRPIQQRMPPPEQIIIDNIFDEAQNNQD